MSITFFKLIDKNKFFFILLSFLSFVFFYLDSGINYNVQAITLFFIVAVLSLYGIFLSVDQWSFSLNKTYHIFTYFFFSIAPVIQLKNQISFFNGGTINDKFYVELSAILFLIQLTYLLLYRYMFFFFKKEKFQINRINNFENRHGDYLLISCMAFVCFLILVKFDANVIFKRPPNHWQKENTNFGLIGYTLLLIIRAIPIMILLLYKYLFNKTSAFLLILAFFTAYPLSLNRADIVMYYLPIIIVFFPFMKRKLVYPLSFFFGILFVFPFLNFFRASNNNVYFGENLFVSAHLDAFYNFANLYKDKIITYGNQLLGSMFFFIQDSVWKNRPVGTGQMVAELNNYSYTNVSMPFLGEGYANFGLCGVFLFLITLVIFNVFSDVFFHEKSIGLMVKVFYLFFLGFEFYLLRGDLYSSIKKGLSFLIAILMIKFSLFFLNKIRMKFMV